MTASVEPAAAAAPAAIDASGSSSSAPSSSPPASASAPPHILVGVLAPSSPAECAARAEDVASRIRNMCRDRVGASVLTQPPGPPRWPSLSPGGSAEADIRKRGMKQSKSKSAMLEPEPRPDPTVHWPHVHVLVCCLRGADDEGSGFPFEDARRFVERMKTEEGRSVLVLTDLDIDDRFLGDRGRFYDTLEAGGLGYLLPRRAVARRRRKETQSASGGDEGGQRGRKNRNKRGGGPYSETVVDRRDLVEVGRTVLLKPVLERPLDPSDPELRVYYPRSDGGGCKVVAYDKDGKKASSFLPDASIRVRAASSDTGSEETGVTDLGFIYEELLPEQARKETESSSSAGDSSSLPSGAIPSEATAAVGVERERRYRKRDRLRDAASVIVPTGLLRLDPQGGSPSAYYDDEEITYESDLSRPDRTFWIVTTAALPWMTGTAVNPLLRAAYLSRGRPRGSVTLVVPWLERAEDREKLYGSNVFADESEQETYIRAWLRDKAGMAEEADEETGLQLLFYPSRYHAQLGSIFAMGDICKLIPDGADSDVCVLEEPEHLNWFRASGDAWTEKFTFVVGIVHTNYKAYASAHYTGIVSAPIISGMSTLMVRAYCHKVIKLSAVLQTFAPEKEIVSNVHGVRAEFLQEGERRAKALRDERAKSAEDRDDNGRDGGKGASEGDAEGACVYFIGKILWAKGLDRLLHLEEFYRDCTGSYFDIDIYGDGPEMTEIRRAYHGRSGGKKRRAAADLINRSINKARASFGGGEGDQREETAGDDPVAEEAANSKSDGDSGGEAHAGLPDGKELKRKASSAIELPLSVHEWRMNPIPARFMGRKDHAALTQQYKVIVNPSITEVLCTTTAEALAMGKFAIIPVHPSNTFFLQFPNCLAFRNKLEFAANLQWALTHEPEPLTEELAYQFTWEAATERFIRASAVTMREGRVRARAKKSRLDERIAYFHNKVGGGQKGDVLRTILGAGPVSGQTQYMARQRANSFSSEASFTLERTLERSEEEAEKRQQRTATFSAIFVLVTFALFIIWRVFDSTNIRDSNEL